ncbi:MAG TPA: hypothetical protein VNT26_14695, partial [Candidatus Sulfotelmatobacter sp.]|nr:hypothetical protein [Candidatus Sulfotelmatobacter sp.]
NERLADAGAQASRLTDSGGESPSSELLRLRNQAGLLRQAQEEVERLKAEQNALRQQLQAALADATETRTNREQRVLAAKQEFAADLATSAIVYWSHHGRQIPETLGEIVAYALVRENIRALAATNGISEDQFELISRTIPPAGSPPTLLLREKQPWRQADGTWARVYATSAGGARVATSTNSDFTPWEQARLSQPGAL